MCRLANKKAAHKTDEDGLAQSIRSPDTVYQQLCAAAAFLLAHDVLGQTFEPADLVHEAYIRLTLSAKPKGRQPHCNFIHAMIRTMRRVVLDVSRRKRRLKRGAGWRRNHALEDCPTVEAILDDQLDLSEAVRELYAQDVNAGGVIILRFYVGFTLEQAAECLGISTRTAKRKTRFACDWLHKKLTAG